MATQYRLNKSDFSQFVANAMNSFEFVAPVKGDETKLRSRSMFREITNAEEIWLEGIPYFPAKNFFFDKNEVLFNFKGNEIIDPKIFVKDRVFFGLRRCDLNGIKHQDKVFLEENKDPFYEARRKGSVLIGFHCKEGDDYCFCNSIGLEDFFDLMFFDKGDFYGVEIGSDKGKDFVNKFSGLFLAADNVVTEADKEIKNTKQLSKTEITEFYGNDAWKEGADECLSCGACNHLCPNCHCFTVTDEMEFDLTSGRRVRVPAGCQQTSFTRCAGEHIFRKDKVARFKHRIFHQIQYFKDRHGETFCTGCGRCIRGCPAEIDWVGILNKM